MLHTSHLWMWQAQLPSRRNPHTLVAANARMRNFCSDLTARRGRGGRKGGTLIPEVSLCEQSRAEQSRTVLNRSRQAGSQSFFSAGCLGTLGRSKAMYRSAGRPAGAAGLDSHRVPEMSASQVLSSFNFSG